MKFNQRRKAFLLKTFYSSRSPPVGQSGHVVWDAGIEGRVFLQMGGA